MAGEWIKMTTNLHENSHVQDIAEMLCLDELHVVGMLWRLWSWADSQTTSGNSVNTTEYRINKLVSCDGFCKALRHTGWLSGEDKALNFTNFDVHNGTTAKKRCQNAKRQEKFRNDSCIDFDNSNATSVTKVTQQSYESNASTFQPVSKISKKDDFQPPFDVPSTENNAQNHENYDDFTHSNDDVTSLKERDCINSNAPSVTKVTLQASPDKIREDKIILEDKSILIRNGINSDSFSPPNFDYGDERFNLFVSFSLSVNPSWLKTPLNHFEEISARKSYSSKSITPKDIKLLKAYYASNLNMDSSKVPFWRTDSRQKFFDCFADLFSNAQRWAKETKYFKPKSPKPKPKTKTEIDEPITLEEFKRALQ